MEDKIYPGKCTLMEASNSTVLFEASFLVDASSEASLIEEALPIPNEESSKTLFSEVAICSSCLPAKIKENS